MFTVEYLRALGRCPFRYILWKVSKLAVIFSQSSWERLIETHREKSWEVTMAHKVTTFLFGNLNLSSRDNGSSKTGTQQISAFVLRVALDSSETLSSRQDVRSSYDEWWLHTNSSMNSFRRSRTTNFSAPILRDWVSVCITQTNNYEQALEIEWSLVNCTYFMAFSLTASQFSSCPTLAKKHTTVYCASRRYFNMQEVSSPPL